jgi:prepilin-type N-terminal cleavage/methylation domain-containing protein
MPRRRYDANGKGSREHGETGFTLIELMIVIAIIAVIAAIAIPSLIQSRKHADEGSAIANMREIVLSQSVFREGDREKDGNVDYGMLSELTNQALVDRVMGSGTKAGYIFRVDYSVTSSEFLWYGVAEPAVVRQTGDRSFAVNNQGTVFYTTENRIPLDNASCRIPGTYKPIN